MTDKANNNGKKPLPEAMKKHQFKAGNNMNPAGRPKGAKSKFSESFYQDMLLKWQEGGVKVLQEVMENDPSTFLRVAASILPKDININNTQDIAFDRFIEGLENEQLHELVTGLQSLGRPSKGSQGDNEAGTTDKPNSVH